MGFPKRKELRLQNYDYSSPGVYFVTICTKERRNYFWDDCLDLRGFEWKSVGANCVRPKKLPLSDIGKIVAGELEVWNTVYDDVSLRLYAIMPNHLHIMVVILADELGRPQVAPTLDRMVKQFKGAVSKKVGHSIWQKSFYEHIIRDRDDYDTRAGYILENPLRWQEDCLYINE